MLYECSLTKRYLEAATKSHFAPFKVQLRYADLFKITNTLHLEVDPLTAEL